MYEKGNLEAFISCFPAISLAFHKLIADYKGQEAVIKTNPWLNSVTQRGLLRRD